MSDAVWYISKYFGLPEDRVGSRSFLLLREIAKMGCKPIVFTASSNHLFTSRQLQDKVQLEEIDGVQICWMKLRKYSGARSLGRILSWLEFEWRLWLLPKDDFPVPSAIVVSTLSLFTIFNGLMLRRRYGCRLIFEVRDIWPLTIVEEGGFSPSNPFVMALQWIERLAYRKSDVIIGTMPNIASHVREVAGVTGPIHCIPMGIDKQQLEAPAPLPDDYAAAYIPSDKFIVCHAGTIGQTNALEVLFEAARSLQLNKGIHFLLVGEGDLKEKFQDETAELPNVSFAPAVPKQLVLSVLRRCDVTFFSTHPSKVWEFGMSLNKVNDYMLAGRPIIGSYSGYPSMLNESGGGVFVPAGDPVALRNEILRLASLQPEERGRMGQAARAWMIANRQYRNLAHRFLAAILPDRWNISYIETAE